jgi:hypothetical protein
MLPFFISISIFHIFISTTSALLVPHYDIVEASTVHSDPFWMPKEFDIGEGYFKANIFILGLKENTGLINVCVSSQATDHKLCHYMNAAEEEGQVIAPNISVHAGIFVFPSSYVPVDTDVDVCITILSTGKIFCKDTLNSSEQKEETVDINLNQ